MKVQSVVKNQGTKKVYDLLVPGTHNYVTGDGFVVHNCDALRYFAVYWTRPNAAQEEKRVRYSAEALEDWYNADPAMRPQIEKYYGGKPIL